MITIIVKGIPEAQARPRFGRHGVYSPKTAWYGQVFAKALHKRPRKPMDGPISLAVTYIFPRPKGIRKDQFYKWTKPDLDNLQKAVKDALTAAKIWQDDGRVCKSAETKRYVLCGEKAGAIITVNQIHDGEEQ